MSGFGKVSKKLRNSGMRKVGESSGANPPSRLDTWFSSEKYKSDYSEIFGNKGVIPPKFIKTQWFAKQGFDFPALLEYQGVTRFMEFLGNFYPELVKVFYTIVKASMDGHLIAEVKGRKIVVDDEVWEQVTGLSVGGIRKFEEEIGGYSRIDTYREMLLDPSVPIRSRLGVGGLSAENRLIMYLITYVLTPRARNHAQLTDDDLQIIHGLKTCQKMNWPMLICENIMKAKRLIDTYLPYALLISHFIEHFGIDTTDEVVDRTSGKRNSEITQKQMEKLGMKKVGGRWTMTGVGPALSDDEMEATMAYAEDRAPPPMSHYESLMIQKMDAMLRLHQDDMATLHSRMDRMENDITDIKTRLVLKDSDEED